MAEETKKEDIIYPNLPRPFAFPKVNLDSAAPEVDYTERASALKNKIDAFRPKGTAEYQPGEVSDTASVNLNEMLDSEQPVDKGSVAQLKNRDTYKTTVDYIKARYKELFAQKALKELERFAVDGTPIMGLGRAVDPGLISSPEYTAKAQETLTRINKLKPAESTTELLTNLWIGTNVDPEYVKLIAAQLDYGLQKASATSGEALAKLVANESANIKSADVSPDYIIYNNGVSPEEDKSIDATLSRLIDKENLPAKTEKQVLDWSRKAFINGLLMKEKEGVNETMSSLMLTYADEAWEKLWKGKASNEEQKTFTKGMEDTYGKDWKPKLVLWLAKEVVALQLAKGATPAYGTVALKSPFPGREALSKVLYGAIEGLAYAVTSNTIKAPLRAYTEGGGMMDKFQDTLHDALMFAAVGGGLSGFIWGLAKVGTEAWTKANAKIFGEETLKYIIKQRKELGDVLFMNATEKAAAAATDPGKASSIAKAADNTSWGEVSPLNSVTGATANTTNFDGVFKLAYESGKIQPKKIDIVKSGIINYEGLVESNRIGYANVALREAERKKQDAITFGITKQGDRLVAQADSLEPVVLTPVENLVKSMAAGETDVAKTQLGWTLKSFLRSPSEWSVATKALQFARTRVNLWKDTAMKNDLKELRSIYDDARLLDDPTHYKLERALVAGNDTNTVFDVVTLKKEYGLNDKQVVAYHKLQQFSEKMWTKENILAVQDAIKNEKRFINWNLDGKGQQGELTFLSPRDIANKTDDELMAVPHVKKAVDEWMDAQQDQFKGIMVGSPVTERPDYPLNRLRRGEHLVKVRDLGDPDNYVVKNGTAEHWIKPEEVVDPTRIVAQLDGYFPVEYKNTNHMVTAINPKTGDVSHIYASQYGWGAKEFIKNNKDKFRAQGQELSLVSFADGGNASVTNPIELLAKTKGTGNQVNERMMRNFISSLEAEGLKLTQEQKDNLWDSFVRSFVNPKMQNRGDEPLKGFSFGGRLRARKDKEGNIKLFQDKTAAPVYSSERAWEIRVSKFYNRVGEGYYRENLAGAFESEFKDFISNPGNGQKWYNDILSPDKLPTEKLLDPKAWTKYRNALAVQTLLFREFGKLNTTERLWQSTFQDWAGSAATKALNPNRSLIGEVALKTLSAGLEEVGDVRQVQRMLKSSTAAQVFFGSISATLQQLTAMADPIFRHPLSAPKFIAEGVGLASTYIPGFKNITMKNPLIKQMRKELDQIGFLADMRGISEYGLQSHQQMMDVFFATFYLGEGTARIASFAAARDEMYNAWRNKAGAAGKWFTKDGKALTPEGMNIVLEKSIANNVNLTAADAPQIGTGFASVAGQFVINPAIKLGEKYIFGNSYSKSEKLRMAIGAGLTFGPGAIYMFDDTLKGISSFYESADNYFAGKGWQENPTTAKETVDRAKLDVSQWFAASTGLPVEYINKFMQGGAVGTITGDKIDWNLTKRLYMGAIVSDTTERFGTRSLVELVPALSIWSRGAKGLQSVWFYHDALQKELGANGLITDESKRIRGDEYQAIVNNTYERAAIQATQGVPGIQRLVLSSYALGMNFTNEKKWLDSKQRAGGDVENMDLGDYLHVATGYGKDYAGIFKELNDIKVKEMTWVQEKALEVHDLQSVSPAAAQAKLDQYTKILIDSGKEKLVGTLIKSYIWSNINADMVPDLRAIIKARKEIKGSEDVKLELLPKLGN